ncbi:F-box/LRR-repeat protein 6-like [Musca vetustissima]|uniref:F-box/LRR-repeat protein 6-like n=1 Tax=Musca vetustissima TaxID=27455 RepID=UPI002AB77CF8|nr:F-box/LRR-repeat protein 6-like [Musca vetustissima]
MEAMDIGDKEDSSATRKYGTADEAGGGGEGGNELGGIAADDGALSTTNKTKDKNENSQNAGIHTDEETNTKNNLSPNKTATTTIVEDCNELPGRRSSNNDKSMALTLTPSTTEEPSQSPTTSIGGGGTGGGGSASVDSDGKMQSPSLTSPAASTPASTPPSETGQADGGGDGGGDYSPHDITGGNSSAEHSSPTADVADQTSMDVEKPQQSPTLQQQHPPATTPHIQHAINVVRNGTIPNAGKPLMSTISKKFEKSAKSGRTRKPKAAAGPMYESEISENKTGIKLCIKKSDSSLSAVTATAAATAAVKSATTSGRSRKSSRNPKQRIKLNNDSNDEADELDYEPKRKKERSSKRQSATGTGGSNAGQAGNDGDEHKRPIVEQSIWGRDLPEPVLFKIFQNVVEKEGCLPTLFRLGRVCSLWRRVSLSPTLWRSLDLTTWIKEKYRTELKLKWFVDNRCTCCTELNVSNFKVTDINCFLMKLADGAPNLTSITLSGWKGFSCDHLAYLVENMKKLERLDLSSVNVEMNASKSAVGVQSLCNAMQVMGDKLTHLYLAHNRLAGIPQLVNVLSTHCPNLVLLDLSNVTTQATSHGILHVEKLQQGCPKLKVLRITNSHITLSTASLQEMMDSPGFPELEELSVAVMDESRVIGDEHIQRILKSSSKLKLLDVRGCARLTHESLIRLPTWDVKHLFLSGCSVTRDMGSGLELIASKWAHSLIELDLAWANVQQPLDNALRALADKGAESRLAHLNLCGSSVSEDAVKEILANCPLMSSINLASCRGLPRGVKRQMQGPQELNELREVLKVQLKVKLPETNAAATSNSSSSTAAVATTTKTSANSNDGGGGGGGGTLRSP